MSKTAFRAQTAGYSKTGGTVVHTCSSSMGIVYAAQFQSLHYMLTTCIQGDS
jgi:hypothetical protein